MEKEILAEKDAAFSTEGSIRVIISRAEYDQLKADSALLKTLASIFSKPKNVN